MVVSGQGCDDIDVQYWYRIWPDGGGGGWQRIDDPYMGEYVSVHTEISKDSEECIYTFKPLSKAENPKVENEGFDFRKTYKIKLVFKENAVVKQIAAYSDSVWKSLSLKMDYKAKAGGSKYTGNIYTRNARIKSTTASETSVLVDIDYAYNADRLSEDRGLVVFPSPTPDDWQGFSVFADDVEREGCLYVRDIDAFISDASKNLTVAAWKAPEGSWDDTIMGKISRLPEQSLEQVMSAMPAKDPREVHLGVANQRQEFTILPSGSIELLAQSLRSKGPDKDRTPWNIKILRYNLSTSTPPDFTHNAGRETKRWLEEGWLPVIHTSWSEGALEYAQECYATMLEGGIADNEFERRGDEPLVLLDKITVFNTGTTPATATLTIDVSLQTELAVDADGMITMPVASDGNAYEGLTPVRGRIKTNGKGQVTVIKDYVPASEDSERRTNSRNVIQYSFDLQPGESHTYQFNMTYVELLTDDEIKLLTSHNYDTTKDQVLSYWKALNSRGMSFECPEPWFNDFYKANLWHIIMSTDKDPGTGLYHQGAATMRYPNFANETCMVSQSLEMRGEYEEAWRLLEPFRVCQGVKGLPGGFKSKEGVLYAAHPDPENDDYTAQGYNMHHGWVLWKFAEHYRYTKDREFLEGIAPNLIAACDWVTSERQGTMADGDQRELIHGLAPPGDLEDVEEYLYWYATNAYYYVGMKLAADVLAEIEHPEAGRLHADAEAYKKDILTSLQKMTEQSPVVKQKDGTYIPYVPPRVYVHTHNKEGWIREGLYPSLHVLDGELVTPESLPITWLLNDLEDNVFLSAESGYNVVDQETHFFNFGGFNLQPNLCPNAMAHLRRDEIPHFIRVLYNTFWSSYYPDTACFAEWVPHYGKGGGPLYKTPDEAKFIQFMRNMVIFEEGDELWLGAAIPRKWMENGKIVSIQNGGTFFGEMSIKIESKVSEDKIIANAALPKRNPAKSAWLRFRHPEGLPIKSVTINGQPHADFDPDKERIYLPDPAATIEVVAYY